MIKQLLRHSSQVDPSVVLNKRLSVPSHYKQQFRRYSATFPPPKMSSSSSTALDSSISTDIHTTTINKPVKLDLYSWAKSCASSWAKHMTAETRQVSQFLPRQVKDAHFTYVQLEPVPSPYFVAASRVCAEDIGLDPEELKTEKFLKVFAGNEMLPGLDRPYCTVYGCHSYGQWFGQLGDGRAMALGEISVQKDTGMERFELQLKGCGRSPYSRGFDGRAVLRSSVREYLVSEAMHHLGVPTTRALSLVGTGETIQRPWYDDTAAARQFVDIDDETSPSTSNASRKYPPRKMINEPGAILCRVARSFLRFTHLEIFSKRGEWDQLMDMADFVCFREFPHLLDIKKTETNSAAPSGDDSKESSKGNQVDELRVGPPERYVQLFREIAHKNAQLVAEWLRVGYIQGNMNSDNTCLAGRTIDYGPYGWIEKYDPFYQPFTSDPSGNFAFARQPSAMAVNVQVLGETFNAIVTEANKRMGGEAALKFKYKEEIKNIYENEFPAAFIKARDENQRRKLGLLSFNSGDSQDKDLWIQLESLLYSSQCDYTIFFRELSQIDLKDVDKSFEILRPSFYDPRFIDTPSAAALRDKWVSWLTAYSSRLKKENRPKEERIREQNSANPKYVLRNWMSILAYERAAEGDMSIIFELEELLQRPYEEGTSEQSEKWYRKTPTWAREMPGCTFMSCSS